jgi:sulfur-oxidizing protein SoxA
MPSIHSSVKWFCTLWFILPGAVFAQSGNVFLSPDLLQVQNDASRNPTQLWVEQGLEIWGTPEKKGACVDCHKSAHQLKHQVTQFPKWSADTQQLINLEDQILTCSKRSGQDYKGLEHPQVLALSALLHQNAAGKTFNLKPSPGQEAQWQADLNAGAHEFTRRIGRMNLACNHCHDQNIGKQMRADVISPGHPTGFPIFKMSWQGMGSIDRRLRACYSGVQAEIPAPGSPVLRQLELFLKVRAQGLPIDGPSLRR